MNPDAFASTVNDTAFRAHIAKSLQICRDGFPDVYFGMLLDRDFITLADPGKSCNFIRLRSTVSGVLHLKFIEIFATFEDEDNNIASMATLSLSSVWPGSEVMLYEKWFLNPHDNLYGFHTDDEPEPWAIVALDAAAPVNRIVIHNRTDKFGPRAWSLAVDVSDDGQTWQEIYNHSEREAQFKACLLGAALHATEKDLTFRQRCLFDRLLIHVLRREYLEAEKLLWEEVPDHSVRRQILAGMNAHVTTAGAGFEWTNHGVKRTFRFWSDVDKKKYIQDTVDLLRVIAASDTDWEACLGYGHRRSRLKL
jgi:hypothetical protein